MKIINSYQEAKKLLQNKTIGTWSKNSKIIFINGTKIKLPLIIN